jgi:hypothetical protein
MNLFVSYSRRDGMVTNSMLERLGLYLSGFCFPFIHCLAVPHARWQQLTVIKALIFSDAILLIESPAAKTSEWVRRELFIARLLRRPVLRLSAADLWHVTPQHQG